MWLPRSQNAASPSPFLKGAWRRYTPANAPTAHPRPHQSLPWSTRSVVALVRFASVRPEGWCNPTEWATVRQILDYTEKGRSRSQAWTHESPQVGKRACGALFPFLFRHAIESLALYFAGGTRLSSARSTVAAAKRLHVQPCYGQEHRLERICGPRAMTLELLTADSGKWADTRVRGRAEAITVSWLFVLCRCGTIARPDGIAAERRLAGLPKLAEMNVELHWSSKSMHDQDRRRDLQRASCPSPSPVGPSRLPLHTRAPSLLRLFLPLHVLLFSPSSAYLNLDHPQPNLSRA